MGKAEWCGSGEIKTPNQMILRFIHSSECALSPDEMRKQREKKTLVNKVVSWVWHLSVRFVFVGCFSLLYSLNFVLCLILILLHLNLSVVNKRSRCSFVSVRIQFGTATVIIKNKNKAGKHVVLFVQAAPARSAFVARKHCRRDSLNFSREII